MNMKSIAQVTALALFLGIFTWPYEYYQLLRIVVFLVSAYFSHRYLQLKLIMPTVVFLGIAILFNPILPIYLLKSTWILIDIFSSLFFIYIGNNLGGKYGNA